MTRINTNVPSLVAQNRLQSSNADLQQALTRLSTGLRINSGADDPAGLIASEALRSEVTSLGRAISNTRRASQIISTADSALGQTSNLLNDIRGLVVEAANSGALSDEEIAANQLQIDSSLEAINRIAQTTTFQGRKLLDGSLDFISTASSVTTLANSKIDQANLGATGRIDVAVDIQAAATQARVTSAVAAFGTTEVAPSSVFGTGSEQITLTAALNDLPATLNANASGFGSVLGGASATISIGSNNAIELAGPTTPTTAQITAGAGGFNAAGPATLAFTGGGAGAGPITLTSDANGANQNGFTINFVDDVAHGDNAASAAYVPGTDTLTVTYNSAAATATNRDVDSIIAAINGQNGVTGFTATTAATGTTDFGAAPAGGPFVSAGGTTDNTLIEALAFEITGADGTQAFSFAAGTTGSTIAAAVAAASATTGVTAAYTDATNNLVFTSTAAGANASVAISVTAEGGTTPFTSALSGTSDTGNDVTDFNNYTLAFNDTVGFGDNPATATISGSTITVNYNSAAATATNSDLNAITSALNGLGDFSATLTGSGNVPFVPPAGTVTTSGAVDGNSLLADLSFKLTGDDGEASFTFTRGTSGEDIATAINVRTSTTGITAAFTPSGGLTFTSAATGEDASIKIDVTSEGTGGAFRSSLNGTSKSGTNAKATDFNDVAINFVDIASGASDEEPTASYNADSKTITVSYNSLAATATNKDYNAVLNALNTLGDFSATLASGATGTTAFTTPAAAPNTSGGINENRGLNANLVFQLNGATGSETFNFGLGTTGQQIADAVNLVSDSTGVTATFDANGLNLNSTGYGSAALVNIDVISEGAGGTFSSSLDSLRNTGTDIRATINGVEASGKANTFSINTSTLDLSLTVDDGSNEDFTFSINGGGALFQLGPDVTSNQQARLGIGSVSTGQLGGATGRLFELGSGQARSLTNDVSGAARIIDEVVDIVTSLRGRLGAFQATSLESNIISLNETLANLEEAESSIRDADFAKESANLTRAQILVQSGTNVLSLANQNPQNVLSLLR
jgi:flagellin